MFSAVATEGSAVTVTGNVLLPPSARYHKRRVVVALALAGGGQSEAFTARLSLGERFTVTHTTKLGGTLRLYARARIAGRLAGKSAIRAITVQQPVTDPSGSSTPPPPGSPPPPSPEAPHFPPHYVPCTPAPRGTMAPGMGQLTGGIYMIGGPYPGEDVCISGTVVVTTPSGEVVATVRVGVTEASTEGFSISLPSGSYLVGAASEPATGSGPPTPSCFANEHQPISVPSEGSVEVVIYCNIA